MPVAARHERIEPAAAALDHRADAGLSSSHTNNEVVACVPNRDPAHDLGVDLRGEKGRGDTIRCQIDAEPLAFEQLEVDRPRHLGVVAQPNSKWSVVTDRCAEMNACSYPHVTDPPRRRSWLAPLLGIVFFALFVLACAGSEDADPDTSGAVLIAKHAQGDAAQFVTGTALIIAAIVLVFLGGWLRQALRSATSRPDWLLDVALAGIVVHALTLTVFVSSAKRVQDGIATGDPTIARTLNIADGNIFVTAMLGLACVLVATGISAYRSGVLPRWLAIATIVLGVMAPLGPGGFAPVLLFPIWVIVVGFVASSTRRATTAVTVRPASAVAGAGYRSRGEAGRATGRTEAVVDVRWTHARHVCTVAWSTASWTAPTPSPSPPVDNDEGTTWALTSRAFSTSAAGQPSCSP